MTWDLLHAFLAAARAGSLKGAAAHTGVDRATVSRRLAELEASLGTALVVRSRDGLALTPAGRQVLADVEAMDVAARRVSARLPTDEVRGVVRLATTESLGPFLVELGLLDVAARFPGLRLDIMTGNARVDLERGDADLAVRLDPLSGNALTVRCLARMPVALFASATYLRGRAAPRAPAQLRGHGVLVPDGELGRLPEAQWLARQEGVAVVLRSNSLPTLVAAARLGQGIVALTAPWGERTAGLELLFTLPGVAPRALWLVTTRLGRKRPAIRAVAEHIVAMAGAFSGGARG